MLSEISFEKSKNSKDNQTSSINPQFINRKRETTFKVQKERKDDKRREYFWALFSCLIAYFSREFKLNFNLNFHTQIEAIYGCSIKTMKKVLSFKIYEIISLFDNKHLTEKDNPIIDAYSNLKQKTTLHETFLFFMECKYAQLLDYYFNDIINPKENIDISSFIQNIKKDKAQIINVINEIKTKKGRATRKNSPLNLNKSITSFKDFEKKFLEKQFLNIFDFNTTNSTNNITKNTINNGIQGKNAIKRNLINNKVIFGTANSDILIANQIVPSFEFEQEDIFNFNTANSTNNIAYNEIIKNYKVIIDAPNIDILNANSITPSIEFGQENNNDKFTINDNLDICMNRFKIYGIPSFSSLSGGDKE